MATASNDYLNDTSLTTGELDMATLACDAAIQLDNLLLKRSLDVDAVEKLVSLVADKISVKEKASPAYLLDPAAVVVMHRAVDSAVRLDKPLTNVHELATEIAKLQQRLKDVSSDPAKFQQHPQELAQMRSFCLALSKQASTFERSIDEWDHNNPFER